MSLQIVKLTLPSFTLICNIKLLEGDDNLLSLMALICDSAQVHNVHLLQWQFVYY